MKIRSDVRAGAYSSVEQCQADAKAWKGYAESMESFSKTGVWPAGQPYPPQPTAPPPTYYPPYPPTSSSGGYIQGVWYPDVSGSCYYA
jgi:hypothetical protein